VLDRPDDAFSCAPLCSRGLKRSPSAVIQQRVAKDIRYPGYGWKAALSRLPNDQLE
jgi:hypothetical protein